MITVCIIDYEQSERTALQNAYTWPENGFTFVGEASSGIQALDTIRQNDTNIAFIDAVLPDIEGLTLAKCIREQYPACHIIMMDTHPDFAFAREALRSGVDDILIKPVQTAELADVLQRIKEKIEKDPPVPSTEPSLSSLEETVQQLINFHNQTNHQKNNRLIYLAVEYIEDHLCESELSLKNVASSIFSNESYLSRMFKKEMGINMMTYITKKRIAESIPLLIHTNLKSYEIAGQVGFRDSHYFGICFKKQVGVTIKEFQKYQQNRK